MEIKGLKPGTNYTFELAARNSVDWGKPAKFLVRTPHRAATGQAGKIVLSSHCVKPYKLLSFWWVLSTWIIIVFHHKIDYFPGRTREYFMLLKYKQHNWKENKFSWYSCKRFLLLFCFLRPYNHSLLLPDQCPLVLWLLSFRFIVHCHLTTFSKCRPTF